MITAILLGFLGLFLGMVGLRLHEHWGPGALQENQAGGHRRALHILAGNRGKSWVDPALQWEGVVLQWGWDGQQTPGLLHLPLCIDTYCPSPCSPTHPAHQSARAPKSDPLAMFLEPALGARHEQGVGGNPKVRVPALQRLQSGWEDQS